MLQLVTLFRLHPVMPGGPLKPLSEATRRPRIEAATGHRAGLETMRWFDGSGDLDVSV